MNKAREKEKTTESSNGNDICKTMNNLKSQVDLGAGTCSFASRFRSHLGLKSKILCVEPSDGMAANADRHKESVERVAEDAMGFSRDRKRRYRLFLFSVHLLFSFFLSSLSLSPRFPFLPLSHHAATKHRELYKATH